MKVLVTGGSGLLGKSLQKIVKEYIEFDENSNDYVYHFLSSKDCDLRDKPSVFWLFESYKPDIVIHLASCVGGVYDNMSRNYEFLISNIHINTNIIEACKNFGITKLINILSTCIFPDLKVKYPLTSDQLHNGLPHYSNIGYAYSKRILHVESELLSEYGVDVINLIPTNLYGENDNYNLKSSHVLPALIHKTYLAKKNNTPLEVYGSGSAIRQFLYADDFAKIINYFTTTKFEKSNITCVISPPEKDEISIKDAALLICDLMEFKGEIVYNTNYLDGQYKKTTTDKELNRYFANFEFTNMNDGLKETIKYFVDNYENIRK